MQEFGQKSHNNTRNPRTRLRQSRKIPSVKLFKLSVKLFKLPKSTTSLRFSKPLDKENYLENIEIKANISKILI